MTIVADARFQEPAAAGAASMRLYSWGARALYLGPALGLSPHRNAVAVLAVGLDGRRDRSDRCVGGPPALPQRAHTAEHVAPSGRYRRAPRVSLRRRP